MPEQDQPEMIELTKKELDIVVGALKTQAGLESAKLPADVSVDRLTALRELRARLSA